MKIWIDLRFIKNDIVSDFILKIIVSFINKNKDYRFIIYTNSYINLDNNINTTIKKIDIKIWSIAEQIKFNNILKKDNLNLVLFFNHFKPIFYKREYITFVLSLKEIYYMNFKSYFSKYKFLYLIEKNLKNSNKLIVLDSNTQKELIEKFDINESKIFKIDWFFPKKIEKESNYIDINIRTKYAIKNDFFIYSGWDSIEKNYEKLITVFKRFKDNWVEYDLVILWNDIANNVNLRENILENGMEKNVFFLWELKDEEKALFYKDAIATIFPSFYETFPFKLNEPIFYWNKIIASKINSIKQVFWDEINYFSPISANSIYEEISKISKKKSKTNPYLFIEENFNQEKTTKQLLEIIK